MGKQNEKQSGQDLPPSTEHSRLSELTRKRYDRIAPVYDFMESLVELRFSRWRRELWSRVEGKAILEIGVGTGKNLDFHPPAAQVTAIDISPKMLDRARRKSLRIGSKVLLQLADVQELPFATGTFDAAVATFVFCSVPEPLAGLAEVRRVLKPGGRFVLLEHVLSQKRLFRKVMVAFDPVTVRIFGAHIDRGTVDNVKRVGFSDVHAINLSLDIVKHIEAVAPTIPGEASAGYEYRKK